MSVTPFGKIPFPVTPLNNVTPFTYRDGYTFLELIEQLRKYLAEVIVEGVNDNFTLLVQEFDSALESLADQNTEAWDELNTLYNTFTTNVTEQIGYINNKSGQHDVVHITVDSNETLNIDPLWPTNQPLYIDINYVSGTLSPGTNINNIVELAEGSNIVQLLPAGDGTFNMFSLGDTSVITWLSNTENIATDSVNKTLKKVGVKIDVTRYGAIGDGLAVDNGGIQTAIAAASDGDTVYVPGNDDGSVREYLINTERPGPGVGGGIRITKSGVRFEMADNVVLKAVPNDKGNYEILNVVAPNVVVSGGTLIGDVGSHIGLVGEWGMGVSVWPGAHNSKIERVTVTHCWGDGFYLNGANDVSVVDCQAKYNRRQGLSVVAGDRVQIIRGHYSLTGGTQANRSENGPGYAYPGYGIDIEPNQADEVNDIVIDGVEVSGNAWAGIGLMSHSTRRITGIVRNVHSHNNRGNGMVFQDGDIVPGDIYVVNCVSENNGGVGETAYGVFAAYTNLKLTGCVIRGNSGIGVEINNANGVTLNGCTISGNASNFAGTINDVALRTVGTSNNLSLIGCVFDAPGETHYRAIVTLPAATNSKYIACITYGTYDVAPISRAADTVVFPTANPLTTLPPAATDPATTQTLVNAIRAIIIANGMGT